MFGWIELGSSEPLRLIGPLHHCPHFLLLLCFIRVHFGLGGYVIATFVISVGWSGVGSYGLWRTYKILKVLGFWNQSYCFGVWLELDLECFFPVLFSFYGLYVTFSAFRMSRRTMTARLRNMEAQLAVASEHLDTKQEQLNVALERIANLEEQLTNARNRISVNDQLVEARDVYCKHVDGEVSRLSLDVKLLHSEIWALYAQMDQGVSIVSNLRSKLQASLAREAEKDRALKARAKEWAEFRKLLFELSTRTLEQDTVTVQELLSLSSALLKMDI